MSGDFSRQTFDRTKHYSAVLMQQGRVQLDADWNEQQALNQYRHATEAADVIGPCGAPKDDQGGGFKVGLSGDGTDLTLSAGRLYADGLLCENEPIVNGQPVSLKNQPDLPIKTSSAAGFAMPAQAGRYLIYLDAWQREVTALDDPHIRETALGGPDTTIRAKTVWQAKWLKVADDATCEQFGAAWKPLSDSTGMLTARTAPVPTSTKPCVLPATAGFQRLENQLYRIEIHRGGTRATARWKWSRDNGTVLASIESVAGQKLVVNSIGPDDVLGFASGQWVEVSDDRMELAGQHGADDTAEFPDTRGVLVQIDSVDPDKREITIKASTPLPPLDTVRNARLRRWDQSDVTATANGLAMTNTWIALEDGVEVQFSDAVSTAGDYWLVPARTAINDASGGIEWPLDTSGNPVAQPPHGIAHHYCPLALMDFDSSVFTAVTNGDCRPLFPALTAITAGDVRYDNAHCLPIMTSAHTVQQALDLLCHARGGECTLLMMPGAGWEAALSAIGDGQDAQICFPVGTFPLGKPAVMQNKGHLTFSGCGPGTQIVAAKAEAALIFDGCKSVTVRDIAATSGITAARPQAENLNGTLTFVNCPTVTVEHANLRCAGGPVRAATCITIRNDPPTTNTPAISMARVRHCDLTVGDQQTGMLLVNVARAQVEDNTLQVAEKPDLAVLLRDVRYRAKLRRQLIANAVLGPVEDTTNTNATVTFGNQVVHFRTDPTLVRGNRNDNAWQQAVSTLNPRGIASPDALLRVLERVADQVLANAGDVPGGSPFFRTAFKAITTQDSAVASQGIVVGGVVANDVRIVNNTIQDVMQGIHVGLSRQEAARGTPNLAEAALISGNTVKVALPTTATRERHGIFVGNCSSMVVENNYLTVKRFAKTQTLRIEGMRVFGYVDRRVIIRQNHLIGFNVGVRFNPLITFQKPQWIITDNVATQAATVVDTPANVRPLVRGINDNFT